MKPIRVLSLVALLLAGACTPSRQTLLTGSVRSNLSMAPLSDVTVSSLEGEARTDSHGSFSVPGRAGELIVFARDGYERATVFVGNRPAVVSMQADPRTTEIQEVAWESKGEWQKVWSLVHPDAHAYVTEDEFVRGGQASTDSPDQLVGVVINSLDYVDWNFPGCPNGRLGEQSFTHVAALDVTLQFRVNGKPRSVRELVHRVQISNGLWVAFPTMGCPPGPSA